MRERAISSWKWGWKQRWTLAVSAFALLATAGIGAWAKKPAPEAVPTTIDGKTAAQLIEAMDKKMQGTSTVGVMEMKIVTPRWKRTLKMRYWVKGTDFAFIRMLSPQRERGTASLKRKLQMWNYLSRAEMVIKIPSSMMMGSWMGSDFTNDDLVRASNVSRDYFAKILSTSTKAGVKLAQLELKPKPKAPVVWGKIIVTMRTADLLPIRYDYYNDKDKLIRVMTYSDIKKMHDRTIPTRMTTKTLSKPGNRTELRWISMKFNTEISRRVFSLRNLKSKNW